ncbi:MAG: bifunctional methylenetetrahydrofolate dehydrogenase/methenyltetrahydrofolate cyclohydrolase FolD [Spirochaetaceae bacterium]|nr:bifunctional methylenetetrahydrofolate dehydrogenase/methenyltetrahydrofolate cyclohydrolase FolD [Spirochaetaceae bacterium]MDT8296723.1 bifunctional methylenetetrahydrofolate dehydrogenase/methenyltetrahydrofolate cyclohydrolase FolD [Spirochaetaceae bacterium]
MSAEIIDGKAIAADLRHQLEKEVRVLSDGGIRPGLAVVLVGEDPASMSYVTAKERDCEKVGIYSRDIRLPVDTSRETLLKLISDLNSDEDIHGILVQLPLPEGLDEEEVIRHIDPAKDVDGFHPESIGRLVLNLDGFLPCTPHGVIKMLEASNIAIEGAEVVIVGRSRIVGAPLANLMFRKAPGGNATVTVCHTRTKNLADVVRRADIVIAAAGRPNTVTADMVKDGAVVIDVGVNRVDDSSRPRGYRLVGDVDFDQVKEVARAITPVPGGVGPLTRAMLLWNTVESAKRFQEGPRTV